MERLNNRSIDTPLYVNYSKATPDFVLPGHLRVGRTNVTRSDERKHLLENQEVAKEVRSF